MPKATCMDCGCVFEFKIKAVICPACHKERIRRYAKERNLNKLGNEAYAKKCAMRKAERMKGNG